MKNKVLIPLITIVLLVTIIGYARGAETFTIPPFQEVVRTVGLSQGDTVSGNIAVSGGSGNDINFFVTDPNGNTVLRYDRSTQTSFSFTSSITGTYAMHFDNSFSIFSSKSVTLDYAVTKAIFGLAPEQFYLVVAVIVIVIVIAIIVIAVLAHRRRK